MKSAFRLRCIYKIYHSLLYSLNGDYLFSGVIGLFRAQKVGYQALSFSSKVHQV